MSRLREDDPGMEDIPFGFPAGPTFGGISGIPGLGSLPGFGGTNVLVGGGGFSLPGITGLPSIDTLGGGGGFSLPGITGIPGTTGTPLPLPVTAPTPGTIPIPVSTPTTGTPLPLPVTIPTPGTIPIPVSTPTDVDTTGGFSLPDITGLPGTPLPLPVSTPTPGITGPVGPVTTSPTTPTDADTSGGLNIPASVIATGLGLLGGGGSISDFLFGEEGEPFRIEDVRTAQQIAQAQQIFNIGIDLAEKGGPPLPPGPITAPLSQAETDLLSRIEGFALGDFPSVEAARTALTSAASGEVVNPIFEIINQNPDQRELIIKQILDLLTGQSADPNDPRIQAAITAATRPILERFQDQTDIDRNLFTRAGQFVQPGSSSPFEMASSRRDVGLANALGDTGARIVLENLQAERDRQFNLVDTLSGAFETGQDRQLRAATEVVPFEKGQLEGLTDALDTVALPRLIEQFGLTQGQEQFAEQKRQLIEILRLFVMGNQPQIVSIPGSAGSSGLVGPVVESFGESFGSSAATALVNAIFG